MTHTRAWRQFKRIQDTTVLVASLIYAGGALNAFDRLPVSLSIIVQLTLIWPAGFLFLSLVVPLVVKSFTRVLARYVWLSFQAGFGQTVMSVVVGVGLLGGAAALMYWQVAAAAAGGRLPTGVFSAYAAGIGILAAQAVLVRVLERDPQVRKVIETED
jgi:hypothetical protein